jgi:hypothetical protein
VTSSKPATRYQDIRHNVAKIKDYLIRGGGLDSVLVEQSMAYDAIRMCFLEYPRLPSNSVRSANCMSRKFRGTRFEGSEITCVMAMMKWI